MKNQIHRSLLIELITLLLFLPQFIAAQDNVNSLEKGFLNPPDSAKPRTWWHWTNSNVTKEGITKDLEWMKRAGIGGMQLADVASGQGQITEKKIIFRSPEWLDAVHHAAAEADRLNLEMTVFSSAGWSLAGGPWVKPEQAMKKLVWSEMNVKGPKKFTGVLPSAPSGEGPIRDLTRSARPGADEPEFYRDCIILAFPTPPDDPEIIQAKPVITTGAGTVNGEALIDDDLNTSLTISSGKDKSMVWVQFSWEKPFRAQAVTLANRAGIPAGTLKVSDDGSDFRTLVVLPGAQLYRSGKVATIAFPSTTANYFRFEFTGAPMRPADVMAETTTRRDTVYTFGEMKFHQGARINRWEDKAGFYHLFNYEPVISPAVPSSSAIDPSSILDLTSKMLPDGTLQWEVPEGNWTIIRFGYSLTGAKNRPAVAAGLGYEVDKLSRKHTRAYLNEYIGPIREALGPLYGKSLQYILLDSWEAGMQNWTDEMIKEFNIRRGYDLTPFLPCLTGRVVGNSDISDRVLWDFRRTLADMFAENFYSVVTEFFNKQGIKTYGEASGVSLEILEDALLCKKYVDIPMGEFWFRALHPELMYYQDVRGAASAAHIYGKPVAAAESFTGGGFNSPFELKKIGDYWFTQGINRFVFHTSAHQPLDTKPGNTMVGTHINRNITWAELAEPFMSHLSRISFMLQQGKFVADIAYLLDEGAPSTMPIWGDGLKPSPPGGYDFDYINADVLINRMAVSPDGKLILPDGMIYAILVLPGTHQMTIPVLKKIHELVKGGATVVGPKPTRTPGYSGYPGSEKILSELVSEIWGDLDGISRTRREAGKGRVFWGTPLVEALSLAGLQPDVEYAKPLDVKIDWIHRKSAETDIYFLVNSSDQPVETKVRFRVTGREAELWDPSTGTILPAGYSISAGGTTVPLQLTERQSVFVVFRNKTANNERVLPRPYQEILATVTVPWEVSFPAGMGAPEKIVFDTLKSWTLSSDDGVKYFSGSAEYSKTLELPKSWFKQNGDFFIDLGNVGDIAEISVNGASAGILWKPPCRTNRLAGDQKAGQGKKVLNSPLFVFPGRGLTDSGLLGPVTILKN